MNSGIIESFFLIFSGATCLATIALYTRQPLLVAYIAIGCLTGPYGLSLITDASLLNEISEIGIIFLLFLVGLDLQPSQLKDMFTKSLLTALGSSVVLFAVGFTLLYLLGYERNDAIVAGIAIIFSSTIIGIKLLPTTVLHHRHVGQMVVSLLLVQDLIAIIVLIFLEGWGSETDLLTHHIAQVFLILPLLGLFAYAIVRFILLPIISKFDVFQEFIFLAAIGWCLALAVIASESGLSYEIGAFVAGVSLATSSLSKYIAESLKPLRDFFLVLFFFSVGAQMNLSLMLTLLIPIFILAGAILTLKPITFRWILRWQGEEKQDAREVGMRLGQASEFSLLIVYLAGSTTLLSNEGALIIQGATVATMLLSSYLVIFRYPSPIAVSARLRKN
ncbi:MAG: cation:proton antiporter [Pseudomonadales bacterium]|nr:cation:proton antiporter [Pseudomonadales bacterium]